MASLLALCDQLNRPGTVAARHLLQRMRAPRRAHGPQVDTTFHHRWFYHLTGRRWTGDWGEWTRALQGHWDENRDSARRRLRQPAGVQHRRPAAGDERQQAEPQVPRARAATVNASLRAALGELHMQGVASGSELARSRLHAVAPRFSAVSMTRPASLQRRWYEYVSGQSADGVTAVAYARLRRTLRREHSAAGRQPQRRPRPHVNQRRTAESETDDEGSESGGSGAPSIVPPSMGNVDDDDDDASSVSGRLHRLYLRV